MEGCEYTLPVEQWRQVLEYVALVDLCNVVLTSRHMNSVASLPELWAGMKVNIRKLRESGLAEFYNINRFRNVKQISLYEWQLNFPTMCDDRKDFEFLKEIPGSPLENLDFSCQDLSEVSAELFASAVSHLRIVNLFSTNPTTDQLVALLKDVLSSTTLTSLNLMEVDLSRVPDDLLANSISRLQEVKLRGTSLGTFQVVALLKASLSSTTLTNLDLDQVWLKEVPSELLANSISRLEQVNLSSIDFTTDQTVALLKASLSSATWKNVNLSCVNLSKVPATLLAKSISRLEEVDLRGTCLTTDQFVVVLKASLSSATLTTVNLQGVDLSEVPVELLADSISRLRAVNLTSTHLTTDQAVSLLKASLSTATLRNVKLYGVDLSEVPPELLANSISRLQEARLSWCRLTSEQFVPLLKAVLSSTTLRLIDMRDNQISQKLPADQQYLIASLPAHVAVNWY